MTWPFSRRTSLPDGAALYAAIVAEARRPDYYVDAGVPDTIDGRFAVLASLIALTDIRLGQSSEAASQTAPRLTECFIADMDAQMREAGFGDPGLGKQVRMMVGSLASRVERWQNVIDRGAAWDEAVMPSLYRDEPPGDDNVAAGSALLRDWWRRLGDSDDAGLAEGTFR